VPKRQPIAIPTMRATELPASLEAELLDVIAHEEPTGWRDLASLRPHPQPSRGLDARHLVDLARSIAVLSLIHPIVIDLDDVVVAGSHRYAALLLLASPERGPLLRRLALPSPDLEGLIPAAEALPHRPPAVDLTHVPVRVMPWRAADAADEAWRVEVAENERRRDYKTSEVKAIAARLAEQGYRMTRGGAGTDQRALPVLSALIGRSERQIRRILADDSSLRPDGRKLMEADAAAAARALDRFRRRHGEGLTPGQAAAIRKALDVLDALAQ
jgi:ParB family transcriptional regulator, chromosome partitioning protein